MRVAGIMALSKTLLFFKIGLLYYYMWFKKFFKRTFQTQYTIWIKSYLKVFKLLSAKNIDV